MEKKAFKDRQKNTKKEKLCDDQFLSEIKIFYKALIIKTMWNMNRETDKQTRIKQSRYSLQITWKFSI